MLERALNAPPRFSRRRFLASGSLASLAVSLAMQPRRLDANGGGGSAEGSGSPEYEWALFCVADPGDNPNIVMDSEYENPDLPPHNCGSWSKTLRKPWDPAGWGDNEPQEPVARYPYLPSSPMLPAVGGSYVEVKAIASGPVASEYTALGMVTIGVSATGIAYGNGTLLMLGPATYPVRIRQGERRASSSKSSQFSVTCNPRTGAITLIPAAFFQSVDEQHAPEDENMSAEVACITWPFVAQAGCMGHSENHSDMFGDVGIPGCALYLTGSSNSMYSGTAFFTWTMVLRRRVKNSDGTCGEWETPQDQSAITDLPGPQPPPPRGGSSGH